MVSPRQRASKKAPSLDAYSKDTLEKMTWILPAREAGQSYSDTEREIALRAFVLCAECYTRATHVTNVPRQTLQRWWGELDEVEREELRKRAQEDVLTDMKLARAMALSKMLARMDEANIFELTGIAKTMNEQIGAIEGRASRIDVVHVDARDILASRLAAMRQDATIEAVALEEGTDG